MEKTVLEKTKEDYDQNFVRQWDKIFTEYKVEEDRLWLAGPTSYVFSVAQERFAVDLQVRREEDRGTIFPRLRENVEQLSFILITHQHDDHMCIPLMQALADTDIKWYIPLGTREDLIAKSQLREKNIIWVRPGDRWAIGKLKFRAFYTPHVQEGESTFPQCGYEVITPNGNILIVGDVRDYDYVKYPDFLRPDLCFAHLWAGNDALNPQNYMPMLQQFVNHHARFQSDRYFLCHLRDIGRKNQYIWDYTHAEIAREMMKVLLPDSMITIPRIGDSYPLTFSRESR